MEDVVGKDERSARVILGIRKHFNTHESRNVIVEMPPELPGPNMFEFLIYVKLPVHLSSAAAKLELEAGR